MKRSPSTLDRFSRDARGVAIVEFAMLAPLLILFYVGMAEICQGLMAERRTAHATSAIGDLVAQTDKITPGEVGDVFEIAAVIFAPYPTEGQLKLRVSSVIVDAQGVPKVDWSANQDWSSHAKGTVIDLPEVAGANGDEDFLAPGESAIMAETEYSFTTPFSDLFIWLKRFVGGSTQAAGTGGFNFESTYYLRPRRSEAVTCGTC